MPFALPPMPNIGDVRITPPLPTPPGAVMIKGVAHMPVPERPDLQQIALPKLAPLTVWRRSPDVNPTVPGWYVTRWRAEHPEARLYWDGVWWCRADADGVLHQLQHQSIKNWSCEWKPA